VVSSMKKDVGRGVEHSDMSDWSCVEGHVAYV